jgi:hypothetical protein
MLADRDVPPARSATAYPVLAARKITKPLDADHEQ